MKEKKAHIIFVMAWSHTTKGSVEEDLDLDMDVRRGSKRGQNVKGGESKLGKN